jgi:hypothetical protein
LKTIIRIAFWSILTSAGLLAQVPQDTLPAPMGTLPVLADTLLVPIDTNLVEESPLPPPARKPVYEVSNEGLDAPVKYQSKDSIINDIRNNRVMLFGEATVEYPDILLKADYIEIDWKSNMAIARGLPDSLSRLQGTPQFVSGDEVIRAEEIRFNLQTKKGKIYKAATSQNDLYMLAEETKFIGACCEGETDVIYGRGGEFTVCDHPEPHFAIRSTKQKIIPNKLVIIGPSNLEIMGIPTPLWLPFGFFPTNPPGTSSSGLLFSSDYEFSPVWGYGLRNIGWYFPVSDRLDVAVTSDLYLKGTFRVRAITNYATRYKYRGSAQIEIGTLRQEDNFGLPLRQQTFSMRLNHSQDAKAHPSRTIGGNINFETNNAQRRNFNDPNSVLSSTLSSNFSYSESFPNKPFNLSVAFNHSQNVNSREMTVNFPQFNFQTQTLYPLKRKEAIGAQRWYERVALVYRGEAKASVTASDTTIFSRETLEAIRFGARHDVRSNVSLKFLRYFNFNPNVNYNETWNFHARERIFDPTIRFTREDILDDETSEIIGERIIDTLFGSITDTVLLRFTPVRQFQAGFNVDTKLFGTLLFKRGFLRGIRHVVTPSLGFNFAPDYTRPELGYFGYAQRDTRFPVSLERYPVLDKPLYGSPPNAGLRMEASYSLSSFVEAKVYSKRDSTDRNIRILRRLDLSGSYNFAAPDFQWSPVRVSTGLTFLKGLSSLVLNATLDPYQRDVGGNRIEAFVWQQTQFPVRLDNARASLSTSMTVAKLRAMLQVKKPDDTAPPTGGARRNSDNFLDLFNNFGISHNFVVERAQINNQDTIRISTHSIQFNGNIQLTQAWQVGVQSFGYEFTRKMITYPSFNIARSLHCWEMALSWQPLRSTYMFYIRVIPGSMFDFLNLPYRRGNQDTFFAPGGGGFSGF